MDTELNNTFAKGGSCPEWVLALVLSSKGYLDGQFAPSPEQWKEEQKAYWIVNKS
jgi:hypothetical protein